MEAAGKSPEEIGSRIAALGVWKHLCRFNWAVKPFGVAFPYFCSVMRFDNGPVRHRLFLIEGWQTFHDYMRTRAESDFGVYTTPMEMPHFELVSAAGGETALFRHDPGYVPRKLAGREPELCARLLWQVYGVAMRYESDNSLPMAYYSEKAMFGRWETAPGEWEDRAFPIPDPQPYVERVALPKALSSAAKDLPFAKDETLEYDFGLAQNVITREERPRCVYRLSGAVAQDGSRAVWRNVSVRHGGSLKELWEAMPRMLLEDLVNRGRIPGEIAVRSGRVFRFLRPLCMELPFKLSMRASLPALDALKP